MTGRVLTTRQLNRATLARQLLLERQELGIVEAVEHLLGLQAQVTEGPYQGLWSRLKGFRHEDLTKLIVDRALARATTMRGTLHLHSADDLIGIRALVQPFLNQVWNSNFRKRFGGNDEKAALKAAIQLIDKEPMTAGALGKLLQEKFPSAEPLALTALLQTRETLIQIPPTRIWGSGHAPILTRIEHWLPPPYERPITREALVLRYLRAYGPASINDMQIWSRLTKLSTEFEALRDQLVTFTDETGRTLYDLPDAPRPDAGTPAPVRFLPLYDNAYLGYDDRRRMLSEHTAEMTNMFQAFKPAVLIDGVIDAGWVITAKKGTAVIEVESYRKLLKRESAEIEREGLAFLRFMEPEAKSWEVTFVSKA
jgi:hypothetical protein